MAEDRVTNDVAGYTPETLAVRDDFRRHHKPVATYRLGDLTLDVRPGRDTLWIVVRRKGRGAIALRTIPWAGPYRVGKGRRIRGAIHWRVETVTGVWTLILRLLDDDLMRLTLRLVPAEDTLLTFWPRDLYPLDNDDDPTGAVGRVEAAQRGFNAGICYFTLDRPAFGSVLYVQNLTALNAYFAATQTKPDGAVGGEWPELGYQPPTAPMGNSPPIHPLAEGQQVVISDALVAFSDATEVNETDSAKQFIALLARIYPHLDKPEPEFHDWLERAEQTVRDLGHANDARQSHYGHTYLRPYLGAEVPDSMVQMTVLASLRAYEQAGGDDQGLVDDLSAGIGRFYDKDLGTIRRYLPDMKEDGKDADAVDSWYVYHPLMNLARLAKAGNATAKSLFLDSLAFAVKAAHHFKYVWPIQFKVSDFSVITQARSPQGRGQTDVGGLYAYVMLQAHDLTGKAAYLEEAKAALKALEGVRFNLAYQTNLTAWGAVACLKLWRSEGDERWYDQSCVFVANCLHNCELWNSQIGHAGDYSNFFGLTCLHDAPYMAAYESFEAFSAFDEYLRAGGDRLPGDMRLLLSEYRRYALDVGWYFYPDALPEDALAPAETVRNGHIDRRLSFPLEDVYGDGQPAGQVGQEVYGCGGAFIFAARAFFDCPSAPFRLFCDYPATVTERDGAVFIKVEGVAGGKAKVRVLRKSRKHMPGLSLRQDGKAFLMHHRGKDFREYEVPADAGLVLTWTKV